MAEDDKDRLDRELMELLNELRVALPGVQVLFAFLLTVPFTQRFSTVTPTQKNAYFASILCTAAATALLIAPSAYHRISFRGRDKERMLITSNRLTIVGLAFLAAAIVLVMWVITDVLFGGAVVAIATAAVAAAFLMLWYALPLKRRADDSGSSP
jgi:O-antigen/teichoic acid export membrane protein